MYICNVHSVEYRYKLQLLILKEKRTQTRTDAKMVDPNMIDVNEITGYWTYLQSIDWQDPWLITLIAIHILTTATALLTRNNANFQIFLFLILLTAAYFSESINEYAAENWRSFSKQQYFDSNGLFISTVFSIPILLNCMLLIGAWIYNSTQLMTKLKTAQLKEKLRRERLNRTNSNTETQTEPKPQQQPQPQPQAHIKQE